MKNLFSYSLCILLALPLAFACNKKTGTIQEKKTELIPAKIFQPDTSRLWTDLEIPPTDPQSGTIRPEKFRLLQLDISGMKKLLSAAPREKDKQTAEGVAVNIPMPEGNYQVFSVYETEVMAPELAAKFPEIKSFGGNGISDPSMGIRLDYSPNGFHAFIITTKGGINIDPYLRSDVNKYICYYKQDFNTEPRQRFPVDSVK